VKRGVPDEKIGQHAVIVIREPCARKVRAPAQKASVRRATAVVRAKEARAGDFRLTGIQRRCREFFGQIGDHDLVKVLHRLEDEVPK